jgi:HEPN domain-containing protein
MKSNLNIATTLLQKADNDLKIARIGIEHDGPLDTVAFHVQQAAEKLLKALLASRGVAYPLTHDLRALLNLVVNEIPELESFREPLLPLNPYAVEIRYDHSVNPDAEELTSALSTVEELRNAVRDNIPEEASP